MPQSGVRAHQFFGSGGIKHDLEQDVAAHRLDRQDNALAKGLVRNTIAGLQRFMSDLRRAMASASAGLTGCCPTVRRSV